MTARRRPALVRSHIITGGRAAPVLSTLDHVTLVTSGTQQDLHGLSPEQRSVLRLCAGGWLSVAEIAAHLSLPSSVIKVLVADLTMSEHVRIGATALPDDEGPSVDLLRQVLEGLHALV